MEVLGFIGAGLLALCAIPQAIQSYKTGTSKGINSVFLLSWYLGELIMLFYVYKYINPNGPLFFNYLLNSLLLSIIVYYKYFPRED